MFPRLTEKEKSSEGSPKERVASGYFKFDAASQKPSIRSQMYYTARYGVPSSRRLSLLSLADIQRKARKQRQQAGLKSQQILSKIKRIYTIFDLISVERFLNEHQNVASFALDAYVEVRKYFPSEDLQLEVVSDPDINEGEELFVYIVTSLPPESAVKRLSEFDENWFLDRLDSTNGFFNLNLRFM